MILRPKTSPLHLGTPASATAATPMAAAPGWLRRAVPDTQSLARKGIEDIAIAAGAAIGALDALVRRREKWAAACRQRLALSAAAMTAKQMGRLEDEAALRDAVLLTKPADDVGPAGRMLMAWRRLAGMPAERLLTEASVGAVLEEFGFFARDDETVSDLADELRQLAASIGMVGMVTGAFMAAERHGFGRTFGCWLADVLLAQRLGWTHAVPLLGAEGALGRGPGRPRHLATVLAATCIETDEEWAKQLLVGQARAALRAIDLSGELGRRADKLLAVAPRLRAKGADAIIDRLLNEDALVASRGDKMDKKMSDRSLRRLFDRLVELGAVRELSGRPTFRIYGL